MRSRLISAALVATLLSGAALFWWRSPRPSDARVTNPAAHTRQELWDELQPVEISNCTFARFGEAQDGGYLLCANLLSEVAAGYSYGISGYDGWGCEVATKLAVPVHQYDCFDTRVPVCGASTIFHAECLGTASATIDTRRYDALDRQLATNGHASSRVVVKMDVEGAEWDALLTAPADTLERIDQLVLELHGTSERRFLQAVRRLKQYFYVANLHMNNHSCLSGEEPFGAWAYEVLFVSKRLASSSGARRPQAWHTLDRPNSPAEPDCQAPQP